MGNVNNTVDVATVNQVSTMNISTTDAASGEYSNDMTRTIVLRDKPLVQSQMSIPFPV